MYFIINTLKNMKNKKYLLPLIGWLIALSSVSVNANQIEKSAISIMPPIENQIDLKNYFYDNNWIKEDSKYNQENFFTKKIKFWISIKDEDKENIDNLFLILSRNEYWRYYIMDSKEAISSPEIELNTEEQYKTIIKYDIEGKEIPKEMIINVLELQNKLSSDYWESFSPILFAKMKDWTEKRLSNLNSFVFIPSNNEESKINFLHSLSYQSWYNPIYFYTEDEKLNEIFEKLSKKYWEKYFEVLNKISPLISSKISWIKNIQSLLSNKIIKESDFKWYLKEFNDLNTNLNFYQTLNSKIDLEKSKYFFNEKTKEIFWEYLD